MLRISAPIMHYAWGSTDALPRLLGKAPDGQPWAEAWLGTHPKAPSHVLGADGQAGGSLASHIEGKLPYLLKVISVAAPLSLQVHPNKEQAEEGFAYEEAHGPALDSPTRNYRDDNHKPEMIFALEPFDALCGFREPAEVLAFLRSMPGAVARAMEGTLWGDSAADASVGYFHPSGEAPSQARTRGVLKHTVELLLTPGGVASGLAMARFVEGAADRLAVGSPYAEVDDLIVRLGSAYPGDPGVALAVLLNRVQLDPGEAIFLGAGVPHAYLSGLGVEIMANSDNVLRAGLTPKHVDVEQLERCMRYELGGIVEPRYEREGSVLRLIPPVADFSLADVHVGDGEEHGSGQEVTVPWEGPRIALCLEGKLTCASRGTVENLLPGEALYLDSDDSDALVTGVGRLVVAA